MSAPPWAADRPLTREAAAAAIHARFPAIDVREIEHIGSGWEFDAFLTADGWVFRFPRRAECAALFEPERRVHRLVAAALPAGVAIPQVQHMGEPTPGFPYVFAGHRCVQGVAADTLGVALIPILARALGAALGAIHAIPEQEARAAGVVEMDEDDVGRQAWLASGIRVASELRGRDPIVDQALTWIGQLQLPPIRFAGPLRFIHHDLSPEHVIVDADSGHLAGILDWTDAILGDAARDFVFLVTWRGWEFAEQVLCSYPHAVDEEFRDRLDFMARLLSVMWLADAHEQGGDLAKHIAWVRNAFVSRRSKQQATDPGS